MVRVDKNQISELAVTESGQTLIKAQFAAVVAATAIAKAFLARLRNYPVPSAGPFMKRAHRWCEAQLIPVSGEGQNIQKLKRIDSVM
ncbi:hypothetical protein RW64_20845 [Geobacter sulfurreducens]|nr:hypothetical protein RW64_20845 [Geobacter sulfurreducens]